VPVLGQGSNVSISVHLAVFRWALRHCAAIEVAGQAWRIDGALMKTWLLVPIRNTGGARVSGFHADPVPPDLQRLIDFAFGCAEKSLWAVDRRFGARWVSGPASHAHSYRQRSIPRTGSALAHAANCHMG
jgi:hypothetical protein